MGKEQKPAEGDEDKKSADGRKVRTHLGVTLIESRPDAFNYTAPRESCLASPQTQKGAGGRPAPFLLNGEPLLLHRSALQLLALFFEHRAPAEFDFVAFERQALDQNLVAFLQLVADVLDRKST